MGHKKKAYGTRRSKRDRDGYAPLAPRCPKTKKQSFLSWTKANHAGVRLRDYERSYRCNLCGWWHITSFTSEDLQHRQVELGTREKERNMSDHIKLLSPEDFTAKVKWEGGIFGALDYGLKFTDVDPGTELGAQLNYAWRNLESAYAAMKPALKTVTEILNKIEQLAEEKES